MTFEPPDVNRGNYRFEPVADKAIRYGLGAVKGTGQRRDRGDRRGARGGRPVHQPVRLLRARRPQAHQQAHGRGADQGRRLRRAAAEPRVAAGRVDRAFDFADAQAAQCRPGRPVRLRRRRHARRQHAGAGAGRGRALGRQGAADAARRRRSASTCRATCSTRVRAEVRRFAKRSIDDLIDSASRSCWPASSSDLRVINGQRGRVAIFKLDDKSERDRGGRRRGRCSTPTATLLKDDELVIVQGKVQPDRFSGGVRLNVQQVWDLAAARCRFGKYLRVAVNGSVPPVAEVLRDFPPRRVADRARRDAAGPGACGCSCCARARQRRARPRRRGALLSDRRALARWQAGAHGPIASSTSDVRTVRAARSLLTRER